MGGKWAADGLLCRRRLNRWTGERRVEGSMKGWESVWWVTGCLQGWMDRGMDAGASFIPRRKPKPQAVSKDSPLDQGQGPSWPQ